MNLRINGNQLRFRISQEELVSLCAGTTLEQKTPLPGGRMFAILIRAEPEIDTPLEFRHENDRMTLVVKRTSAQSLLTSLPNKEGIEVQQSLEDNSTLVLQLEIDVRTQKRN